MNEQKYTWSPGGTEVLISIWSDPYIQKQLRSTLRNQPIWDGVAHYMGQKGYRVNGKQCRTRIKNILVRYREIKKSGSLNGSSIEPYFQEIDRVMKQRHSEAAGHTSRSSGKSGFTELQLTLHESQSHANQDVISAADIKLERDSPPNISEESIQGTEEISQDIPNHQRYFQTMDVTLEDQQSSSSACAASPPPLHFFGQTHDVITNSDNLHRNTEQRSAQHTKLEEETLTSRIYAEKNTQLLSHLERLVLRTVRAQNETVTHLMTMQNEIFQRVLEADRERQARLESRMDRMLDRLDRLLPSSQKSCEESSRLNRVLDRLEWLLTPHSVQQPLRKETSKLDILLEKLDQFIPSIQNLQPSKSVTETNTGQV